jgi:hypothetical protein
MNRRSSHWEKTHLAIAGIYFFSFYARNGSAHWPITIPGKTKDIQVEGATMQDYLLN